MESEKHSTVKLVEDTIEKEDIKQLCDWLQSDPTPQLTKGEQTIRFEDEFASMIDMQYGCFVNSGSSAVLLALAALKADDRLRNNKVACPGLSWVTDVTSVMQLGMQPILVDCNMKDLSFDLNHLEQVFETNRPACCILVSVLGLVPDMAKILQLCQEYQVHLIEDTCESLGSEYHGHPLGSLGHISCFSTYFGHHMSTIEGGMCCCNDFDLSQRLYALRSHGWSRDLDPERSESLADAFNVGEFEQYYTFYDAGFNLRSTDLQAYIGRAQLKRLESNAAIRNENFNLYREGIKNNRIKFRLHPKDFVSSMAFPVLLKDRKECVDHLRSVDIEVRPLIAGSMGRQPFYVEAYGDRPLKNCDKIHQNGFYVPNHPKISHVDIQRIVDIINQYE